MILIKYKKFLSSFAILIFSYCAFGQAIIQNKRFAYYSGNYSALNPAHIGIEAEKQLNVQYLSFTGVRKIIKTVYLSGFYSVSQCKSTFGISAYSESQGRFLQDNSVVGSFSFKLFEDDKHGLQAGGSFGGVNYIVKDNEFGFGGSDWGMDANMGVWYKRERYSFGLSYTHLFNTELVPVNEQFILDRSVNLILGYKSAFGENLIFYPEIITQFESISGFRMQLINSIVFKDRFRGICTFHSEGLLGIGAALENFNLIDKGLFGFNFNMNMNLYNVMVINSNQFEIGLRYYFHE